MTQPGQELVQTDRLGLPVPASAIPELIVQAGPAAQFAWEEFFLGQLRNTYTRKAYGRAVRQFFAWLEPYHISLTNITPAMVGTYFDQHPGSPPTRKLDLAAIRGLFDCLVLRHVIVLNPAQSVRGEKYVVIEGKTPEISPEQVRTLLASIKTSTTGDDGSKVFLPLGFRDRAVIATLVYTAARAGAVAKLRHQDFMYDGSQWTLRFAEKGGKAREIPVRHDLQQFILAYVHMGKLTDAPPEFPLFRSVRGQSQQFATRGISAVDICRIVKKRIKDAGLPQRLSPHSFRAATVTDLLLQKVPIEDVQYLVGHSDLRTTRLYDRREKRVTRNIVEKISI